MKSIITIARTVEANGSVSSPTQGIKFVLLLSRQGKVRLSKWYTTYNQKERAKLVRDITPLVLGRSLKLCNFLDYPGMGEIKVIFLVALF